MGQSCVQVLPVGPSALDTSVPGYELTCFWCFATFFVCRRDYRGQGYCRKVCRKHAAAASHRLSSARYEQSLGDEGRQDRRERRLIHAAKSAEAAAPSLGKMNNERLVPLDSEAVDLVRRIQSVGPRPRRRLLYAKCGPR
jgi:hypothetical protein